MIEELKIQYAHVRPYLYSDKDWELFILERLIQTLKDYDYD